MNHKLILKLALKELLREKKFSLVFILGLTLALMGPTWIEATRNIFQSILDGKAKNILGSDLEISGRRDLNPEELQRVKGIFQSQSLNVRIESKVLTLFSMARSKSFSRLVEIRSLDGKFPMFGQIILDDNSKNKQPQGEKIWAQKDIQFLFNVKEQDGLSLGNKLFKIEGFIKEDGLQTVQFASIAPRIYMSLKDLKESGLIAFGSTINYANHFSFEGMTSQKIKVVAGLIERALNTVDLKVITPQSASERLQRPLNYTADYLGLVSIGAFIIGAMACFYLYWSFLNKKLSTLALYEMLGLKKIEINAILTLQLFLMGCIALVFTYITVFALQFITMSALKAAVPALENDATLLLLGKYYSWATLTWPILIGPLTPLILMPGISNLLKKIHPNVLFQESLQGNFLNLGKIFILVLPMLAVICTMSFLLAHSIKVAAIFLAMMAVLSLVAFALYWLTLLLLKFLFGKKTHLLLFLPIRSGHFNRYKNIILGIALTFSTSFLVLIPSLKTSLVREFGAKSTAQRPSFFLFDIQDDQVEDVKKFVALKKQNVLDVSPMVRGKIKSINGQAFVKGHEGAQTREEEEETRRRNRGLNLTYKSALNPAEKIVKGTDIRDLPAHPDTHWVSIEDRYAKSLKLKIGDEITFDIFGVMVMAKVANFRTVRWSSFLPNFFFSLSPGTLEDAPKSHLAAVALAPGTADSTKNDFLLEFSRAFPTVSAIDVEKMMAQILGAVNQITFFLQMMAYYAFFVSLFLMSVVVLERIESFDREKKLYHLMGMAKAKVDLVLFYEMWPNILLGQVIGALSGPLMGLLLAIFVFDNDFEFDGFWLFYGLVLLPMATSLAVFTMIKWRGREALRW